MLAELLPTDGWDVNTRNICESLLRSKYDYGPHTCRLTAKCYVWYASWTHLLCNNVNMSCRLLSQKAASRHISLHSASIADARSVELASRKCLRMTEQLNEDYSRASALTHG